MTERTVKQRLAFYWKCAVIYGVTLLVAQAALVAVAIVSDSLPSHALWAPALIVLLTLTAFVGIVMLMILSAFIALKIYDHEKNRH